ncbi:DNA-methyltransferase [Methylobacterium sp.]|uniref:DNA-methyltransferase n=1 Tax=Methylobacterium sp. TaxID=409 RepID=UPI003B599570
MSNRVEHLAEGVTLYMGDCREILPTLDRFDAVVTDPPYGINITKSNRLAVSRGMGGGSWDAAPIDAATVQMVVGAADQAIVWGGNYFELPPARCFLIWDKQNDGRDFADIEMAWTNIDAVARIKRLRPMNMDGGKVHPTQKPVDLMKWCLGLVSGRVLDPFMGSGSTGVACVKTGKAFVGIEREEKYFDLACRRIADAIARPDMFIAAPSKPTQEALL